MASRAFVNQSNNKTQQCVFTNKLTTLKRYATGLISGYQSIAKLHSVMLLITFKYIVRLLKYVAALTVMIAILIFAILMCLPIKEIPRKNPWIETTTVDRKFEYHIVKFILLWTDGQATPFKYFGKGSSIFKAKSCKYTNCFVTSNRHELGDSSLFDAIIFNGPQLPKMLRHNDFPSSRSLTQKYVYANIESAQNYPLCTKRFNGFFNWTWTYRLDSDTNWGYFVVKNKTKHVIAPALKVNWKDLESMGDISKKMKEKLKSKGNLAAWFVSNCHTKSRREDFVELVRKYLKNYKMDVHIFGKCGIFQCPAYLNDRCLTMLDEDYYFYFAFENGMSEDYVSEKILNAYRHNTVPVVYGGANYSKFLPPGSYLNAMDLGPEKLASTMVELMKNPEEYRKYFKWQNYYSFHYRHESPLTDDYCQFCQVLNDDARTTIYYNIDEWWNGDHSEYACHNTHKRRTQTQKTLK